MKVNLEDIKNSYFEDLQSKELKEHHKLLESQLSDLTYKELKSRFESSLEVLKMLSENRAHYDHITNKEDINFLKANGLMYLSEYHTRIKKIGSRLKRRKSEMYVIQTFRRLSNNCGILDYVNVKASILGVRKFALRKATNVSDESIFDLPAGFTRTNRISTQF